MKKNSNISMISVQMMNEIFMYFDKISLILIFDMKNKFMMNSMKHHCNQSFKNQPATLIWNFLQWPSSENNSGFTKKCTLFPIQRVVIRDYGKHDINSTF